MCCYFGKRMYYRHATCEFNVLLLLGCYMYVCLFLDFLLTTREATWYIILVVSVCQTITFERLNVGNSYLHIRCISREYWSSSYMKVIGSRSRSQKKNRKSLFPQRKISIVHNFGSIKHRVIRFAYISELSFMPDRVVLPPSLSRDRSDHK